MTTENKLEEILDVELPVTSTVVRDVVPIVDTPDMSHYANNTITQDANESRTYIRGSIVQLQNAINEMLAVAKLSGKPRAYEVATNMLKTLAEMQHDLMTVHETEQNLLLPDAPESEGDVNIEQAVFVGSTSDLAELIKQKRAKRNANTIEVQAQTIESL